jgi:hypothetical protein
MPSSKLVAGPLFAAKIEKEMRRAEKVQKRQLKADVEAIERDVVSVTY